MFDNVGLMVKEPDRIVITVKDAQSQSLEYVKDFKGSLAGLSKFQQYSPQAGDEAFLYIHEAAPHTKAAAAAQRLLRENKLVSLIVEVYAGTRVSHVIEFDGCTFRKLTHAACTNGGLSRFGIDDYTEKQLHFRYSAVHINYKELSQ